MTDDESQPISVLLVEDDPGDVVLIEEAFEHNKVRNVLKIVGDGVEAMEYLRAEGADRPDLVLLDLNLPRMDGREVLAEIKSDPALRSIPVVVLTTSKAEEDILRSYDLHANAYVTKPVDFNRFIEVVRQIDEFFVTVVKLPGASRRAELMRWIVPLAALALVACGSSSDPPPVPTATATATETATASASPSPTATAAQVPARRTVATGLSVPWGIAFLPDDDALVAERDSGQILRIASGGGSPRRVMTVPGVAAGGEGGLLGLAVSPNYSNDRLVYAYLTASGDNRIVRFRLGGQVRDVLTGLQKAGIHNGGRIHFGPDGKLYAGVGDAANSASSQDPGSRNGKILRMDPDGSNARAWTLGHRNVQGFAWDRAGRMWASEFGQNTFDEVNLIQRGRNYGWPEVEGRGPTQGRFTNPKVIWATSEASPSGAAIIGSNLYVAALQGECVWRIPIRGASLGSPRRMLAGRYGRIRTVVAAPDGTLWVATSNRDGRGSPRSGDDRIIAVRV